MRLTPVLSLHTLVQCVYSHSSAHGHTFTRSKRERERGEVERRFMFWFFLNGNFCSALMFAALPTRPARRLWNEERGIYREPRTNTSKLELALKHMYTNTHVPSRIASDLVISSAIFIWHDFVEFIHLLLSCWQVTESPLSLTELWKVQDLHFGLRGRKLTRLQLISGLWKNKSFQRLLILQWQCFCLVKYFSKMLTKPAAFTISWTFS